MKGGYASSWIRPSSRVAIYLRDGLCCVYCGVSGTVAPITLDHLVPRSRRKDNSATNLVTSCQECNQLRRQYPKWNDFATRLGKSPSWLRKHVQAQVQTRITQQVRNSACHAVAEKPLWLRQIKYVANPVNWELLKTNPILAPEDEWGHADRVSLPDSTAISLPCPWCSTLCPGCAGHGIDHLSMVRDDFF